MTFEEMFRSNDDSISGSDVGTREGAPMLSVVRPSAPGPRKFDVQCRIISN
jgi:hypothetical protein